MIYSCLTTATKGKASTTDHSTGTNVLVIITGDGKLYAAAATRIYVPAVTELACELITLSYSIDCLQLCTAQMAAQCELQAIGVSHRRPNLFNQVYSHATHNHELLQEISPWTSPISDLMTHKAMKVCNSSTTHHNIMINLIEAF